MSPDIEIRVESLPRALAGGWPRYLHGAVHPCAWPGGAYERVRYLPTTRTHITWPFGQVDDVGEVIRFEVAYALGEHDR